MSRKRWLILLWIAVGILIILLAISFVKTESQPQWDFNGSHATYYGENAFQGGGRYLINITMKVVFHNSSSAHVHIFSDLTLPDGTFKNQTDIWVRPTGADFNPLVAGAPFSNHSTIISLEGHRVQGRAFAYAQGQMNFVTSNWYSSFLAEENTCVPFPVVYVFDLGNGRSVIVTMTKTNIPGLLPSFPFVDLFQHPSCPK